MNEKNWWQIMFDQRYLNTYLPILTPERTKEDADFIVKAAQLQPTDKILDLACGHGRHCLELASRGFSHITGLDYSKVFIEKAKADAASAGLDVPFLEGDMRNLPFDEDFDVVLSLFTSFGYFEDEENQAVLRQIAKSLKPGARLLLDVMSAEAVTDRFASEGTEDEATGHLKISREESMGGYAIDETEIFDVENRVIHNHREWFQGVEKKEYDYWLHVYTREQYKDMFHNSGLHIESIASENDYQHIPEDNPKKHRTVILAKKGA